MISAAAASASSAAAAAAVVVVVIFRSPETFLILPPHSSAFLLAIFVPFLFIPFTLPIIRSPCTFLSTSGIMTGRRTI